MEINLLLLQKQKNIKEQKSMKDDILNVVKQIKVKCIKQYNNYDKLERNS